MLLLFKRQETVMQCKRAILWLAPLIAFVCGCGKASVADKPSDAIVAAFDAANKGLYSEAEAYWSSDMRAAMNSFVGAIDGGPKGFWDKATNNGTLQRIEIQSEKIRGEGATVFFRVYFKDDTSIDNEWPMVNEGGAWKMASQIGYVTEQQEKTNSTALKLERIRSAIDAYELDCNQVPSTSDGLESLLVDNWLAAAGKAGVQIDGKIEGEIRKKALTTADMADGWGNPFHYSENQGAIFERYNLSSAGPDGIDGTDDDIPH